MAAEHAGMRAVCFHDFDDATVEDVPTPTPSEDEVLIEVRRVQLSVTECKLYRGEKIAHYEQIEARLADAPVRMLGHEFTGEVVEVGEDVTTLAPGDRVYAPGKIPCLQCPYCLAGYRNVCPEKTQIGYDIPGGLAEYVTLPSTPLRTLPPGVTDAEGAAMQPFASAVGATVTAGIDAGTVVAVVGCGVMGYQCAQLARHEGARAVYVTDVEPAKLEIASARGLTTIDAGEDDPVEVIRRDTNGVGADVVFEAVGGKQRDGTEGTEPLAQAMQLVRRGGSVIQVGHIIDRISLTPRMIKSKSVDWLSPPSGILHLSPTTDTGDLAPELVAEGHCRIDQYITHELDGLAAFEELVEITLNKPEHGALGPAQIVVDRDSSN